MNVFTNSNILFDFDVLIDIELGLIRFLYDKNIRKYLDFTPYLCDNKKFIKGCLFGRTQESILDMLSMPGVVFHHDVHYQTYIMNIDDILEKSEPTDFFEFFSNSIAVKDVNPAVWCRHEKEKQFIKGFKDLENGYCMYHVAKDLGDIDLSIYDTIVLSRSEDFVKNAERLKGKSVMLLNTRYNMDVDNDEHVLRKDVAEAADKYNIYPMLFTKYRMDRSYFIMNEEE